MCRTCIFIIVGRVVLRNRSGLSRIELRIFDFLELHHGDEIILQSVRRKVYVVGTCDMKLGRKFYIAAETLIDDGFSRYLPVLSSQNRRLSGHQWAEFF